MPPASTEPNLTPSIVKACPWYQPLCQVTPVSKYLAMVIFIAMPFVGGYVGYNQGVYDKEVTVQVLTVVPTPVVSDAMIDVVSDSLDLTGANQDSLEHFLFEEKRSGYFVKSGKVYFARPESSIGTTSDWNLAKSAVLLTDADPDTFRVLFSGGATEAGWMYAVDKQHVYFDGILLDMAEASTSRVFGHRNSVLQSNKGIYATGQFVAPGTIENLDMYTLKIPVDDVVSPYSFYVHDVVADLWYSTDSKNPEPIQKPSDVGDKWVY